MNISVSSNIITITGNIKSVHDYQEIKSALDNAVLEHKSVVVVIKDSISITSSIIGYFTKLVQKEGIDLSIEVGDANLMELFEDLHLMSIFKVKKA